MRWVQQQHSRAMERARIFISSPGDVAEERARAQDVVTQLQEEFAESLSIEALLWEQEPLLASSDFQSQIRSPADFDIFATIIGDRLGSPLGDRFTRKDGSRYASGTEYEFEIALESFQTKGVPELLVYRKRPVSDNPPTEQTDAVEKFFREWFLAQDNTATGAYHWFDQADKFQEAFTIHLRKLLRRLLPRPNNIPNPISSFVGRKAELQSIKSTLLAAETRLLTLVGTGGSGKSRLAVRVARDVLPEFEDGVFFVPLAEVSHDDLVLAAIATTLDIKQADGQEVQKAVQDSLHTKRMLLVFENFEHVPSATRQINTLLSGCPELKILVTSRNTLHLTGARTLHIEPFSLPDPARANLVSAKQNDAIVLFVDRAQAVRPDFKLTADNFRQVLTICHRLDGLPLAIELAIPRLKSMEPERLLKALDKRFAVLKGGADELLDHQKSLRELVTWSYELLTPEEQMLWRRMAVFAGGFTIEAAEKVCDPDDEFVVEIEVGGLADKSLATLHVGDETRVTMLGTLREFALEQLKAVGEYDQYQARFVDWIVELAEEAHIGLRSELYTPYLAVLDSEHMNVLAAIRFVQERDAASTLKIARGVWYHWFERGYMAEAHALLEPALTNEDVDPDIRAGALKGLASIARFQTDLATAEAASQKALELYTMLGDQDGVARAIGELGALSISQGNLETAAKYLDQAIAIREDAVPHNQHLSFLVSARGVIHHLVGDLEAAKSCYIQALDIGTDPDPIASAMVNLGEIAEAEADLDAAYGYYRDSLKLFYERGKKVAVAYCTELLAALATRHFANPELAAMLFGFSAALREEINSPIALYNEDRLNSDLAETRASLEPDAFDQAYANGLDLHIDDYLTYIEALEISA